MRIVSGIKPTGRPHLGNYLGAMRQHIAHQNHDECFFFIADYHALTTLRDKELMLEYRRGVLLDYLALGIDPKTTTIFFQSDVPAHTELAWILSTVTPMGLLERAHAWKDALAKGQREKNAGLFTYPILMAADILLYQAEGVPVGKDQKQHVEITRDLAEKFNAFFEPVFTLPEPLILKEIENVPGTDGQKMSKSNGNVISLFEDEDTLKKQVMSLQTRSLDLSEPMPTKDDLILNLYSHFASPEELEALKSNYAAGGFGYGNAKKALLGKLLDYFAEARARRVALNDPKKLDAIITSGAERAEKAAQKTLQAVRNAVGYGMF